MKYNPLACPREECSGTMIFFQKGEVFAAGALDGIDRSIRTEIWRCGSCWEKAQKTYSWSPHKEDKHSPQSFSPR